MKKIFLVLPLALFLGACSLSSTAPLDSRLNNIPSPLKTCEIGDACNNFLSSIQGNDLQKIFSYEDKELGIKMQYPGECYFNKGFFQCPDFSLSIWPNENDDQLEENPQITFSDNKTEVKYYVSDGEKSYFILAWYDGQNNKEIEDKVVQIAQSLIFTK